MSRNKKIVPALMFHSVGLDKHPWAWSYISESLESFEAKIALFKQQGFNGVFWNDVYEHMAGRKVLPDNSILLTFDDGYLDNWVNVFPILRKYDMKGTIFVGPDFVDPGEEVRPNLDDVAAGRCSQRDLSSAGFLNWAEMRAMEKSGLIDIQSHAMTHTWYFTSPKITDYHRPHSVTPYPWLFWNVRPERKPFYLNEDQQEFLPWGYPMFEHEKSLQATRFFPAQEAIDSITHFFETKGGREFFERSEWLPEIETFVADTFKNGTLPGHHESTRERRARITEELQQSKVLIERNLDKQVDFICWPGGAYDESVEEVAAEVGYKSFTLSSRSSLDKRNLPGADPASIKRIGTSNQISVKGKVIGQGGARYQLLNVTAHQGSTIHRLLIKAFKFVLLLKPTRSTAS